MDLSEFVRVTLCQIIDGVVAAQAHAATNNATINPKFFRERQGGQVVSGDRGKMTDVTFNAALTSQEGTATAGRIGVFLGTVNLGSRGSSDQKSVAQTSLQFSVPMVLPTMGD